MNAVSVKIKLRRVSLPELNEAYQKVMLWFFAYPQREMGLNELVEKLQISKTTANAVVELLVREGFLLRQVLGRNWRITCNQQHPYTRTRKISHNLRMVFESGIVEQINRLVPNARAMVLFGSYRKGDDIETSDIDIAVEVLGLSNLRIERIGEFETFGYRRKVPVNMHLFSRETIDANLFANIANGIVLQGFLEAHP